jgi:pyridoxal phosphate enzyme (YggS family)
MITDNVQRVKARIEAACRRVNRDPAGVTLVAVTKGRPVEDILQVFGAGIFDIGENKVQEARLKYAQLPPDTWHLSPDTRHLSPDTRHLSPKWHMIGHLQVNKVKDAVRIFDLIHSVDSLKLAQEIDKQASKIQKVQDILIEVKTSQEAAKYGIHPSELPGLADAVAQLKHVRLLGLMTMAPEGESRDQARPYFRALRSMGLSVLSMGMSDDFETAVEEGATIVRVGRALFEK